MSRPFSSKSNRKGAEKFKKGPRRGMSRDLMREERERDEREERKKLETIDPKDIRTGEPTYDL